MKRASKTIGLAPEYNNHWWSESIYQLNNIIYEISRDDDHGNNNLHHFSDS